MTKVTEHGNVVVVDDVTTEAQEHNPFYDWWMLRRVDTRIVKKNIDFIIGDTFDISSQDDSKDTDHLAFSAVSGDWHGYMMDRFNCKEAKRHLSDVTNLSENVLFVSDSFDMTELEKPWSRIDNGQNLDIDSDLYAEEFHIETLDSSFTHAGLNKGEANIHPHFNENGQLDAILLDFEQKYEYHAGLYKYDIISVFDKEYSVGGLYELTPDTLSAHMTKTGAKNVIVHDNAAGYFDTISKDASLMHSFKSLKNNQNNIHMVITYMFIWFLLSQRNQNVETIALLTNSHTILS